jgi:hypothetical protein
LFSGAISSVVERLLHTQEVAGSNPASRTIAPLTVHDWLISALDGRDKHGQEMFSYAKAQSRKVGQNKNLGALAPLREAFPASDIAGRGGVRKISS